MNFMMYTAPWMCSVLNGDLIQTEVYKNSQFMGKGMIKSSIMTARIIISRSNRKTAVKNTERVKSTGQTRSFKWGCSWMGTGIPLAFSLFPGNANEQDIAEAAREKSFWGFRMPKIYLLQRCRTGFRIHPGIQPYGRNGLIS